MFSLRDIFVQAYSCVQAVPRLRRLRPLPDKLRFFDSSLILTSLFIVPGRDERKVNPFLTGFVCVCLQPVDPVTTEPWLAAVGGGIYKARPGRL